MDNMVDTLCKEVVLRKDFIRAPATTLYFGGGTPSILNEFHLRKIIDCLDTHIGLGSLQEFTIEANPDDLTKEKVSALAALGINRLSLGAQTFNAELLQFINRSHTADQIYRSIEIVQKAGISNYSIDLMYGIPGQHFSIWQQDIQEALSLAPTHISSYALTVEPKTVFGKWQDKGLLAVPNDENVSSAYTYLVSTLAQEGYNQYEVSNFSKPGFESQHNSGYWNQKPYLGIGPGAHSYDGKYRQFNQISNAAYIKKLNNNLPTWTTETLTVSQQITEHILTSIRTYWGVDFNELEKKYKYTLSAKQLNYISKLVNDKLAKYQNQKLILNSKGLFLADAITLALIPEE